MLELMISIVFLLMTPSMANTTPSPADSSSNPNKIQEKGKNIRNILPEEIESFWRQFEPTWKGWGGQEAVPYQRNGLDGEKETEKETSVSLRIFSLDYVLQPQSRPKERLEEFDLNQVRLSLFPKVYVTPHTLAGIGIAYSAYDLRLQFKDQTEYRTFHTLSFPLDCMYLKDRIFFWGRFDVSIQSDFQKVEEKSILFQGGFLPGYRIFGQFWLGLGLYVTDDFGDRYLVPILGIYWQATEQLLFNFVLPQRAIISYEVIERLYLILYNEIDGAQVNFHFTDTLGEKRSEDVQYSFMRMGGGLAFRVTTGVYLYAIGGTTFRTRFKFRHSPEKDERFTDYNSPYLLIALNMNSDFLTSLFAVQK